MLGTVGVLTMTNGQRWRGRQCAPNQGNCSELLDVVPRSRHRIPKDDIIFCVTGHNPGAVHWCTKVTLHLTFLNNSSKGCVTSYRSDAHKRIQAET